MEFDGALPRSPPGSDLSKPQKRTPPDPRRDLTASKLHLLSPARKPLTGANRAQSAQIGFNCRSGDRLPMPG